MRGPKAIPTPKRDMVQLPVVALSVGKAHDAAGLSARLPTILRYGDYVEAAGLMSYGPNYASLFRRAADMVNKILHGTKPADIPVEQPNKFELVINLATARAIGLTLPSTVIARADEVIG